MTVKQPDGVRERILIFGPPGAGKSRAYVDIYDNIEGKVFVIDTDVAVERMFANRDKSRLEYNEAQDYETAAKAMQKYTSQAKAGDWVVVDLLTPTWGWCSDYWAMKTSKIKANTDMSLWLPMSNKDYDWSTINRMYSNFMRSLMTTEANVLVICEETDIMEGKFEGDTDRLFKEFGVKPRGNKRVPYSFHTSLYLGTKNFKTGTQYRISAAKEREGRQCDWSDEPFDDASFVDEYLVGVAGWTRESKPTRRRRK
jgi:hypothetical protein